MINPEQIFIVGAGGQLGTALRQKYPEAGSADVETLDITDASSVDTFDWSPYSVIINAAAYTNVDGAESDEGRVAAWAVNASAVANLAKVATAQNATLVHTSTDYVFDGSKVAHKEDEPFSPLSVYGESKADGDVAAASTPKHYIMRTSWVIGEGKNFVRTMLGLAEKGVSPTVVADQIGRPTFTSELVKAIDFVLQKSAPFGTYNVSNSGKPASWADITRATFELSGHNDLTVTDTTTEKYYEGKDGIAPRPLQSTLELGKIHQLGFESTDWQDDLKRYIDKETQS